MKKKTLIFFIFLFSLLVLGKKLVKVGIYENYPFVFTKNGKVQGFYVDLIKKIAEENNWNIKFIHTHWDKAIERLLKNDYQILVDIAYTPERAKKVRFNKIPVFFNCGVIYVKKNLDVSTFTELAGKKIGIVKNDVYFERFYNIIKEIDVKCRFLYCKNYDTIFSLLSEGIIDAGIVSRIYGLLNEEKYDVKKTTLNFKFVALKFAFSNQFPEKNIKKIDFMLKKWKNDKNSYYYFCLDKWFGMPHIKQNNSFSLKIVWLFFLLLFLLNIVFWLWFRKAYIKFIRSRYWKSVKSIRKKLILYKKYFHTILKIPSVGIAFLSVKKERKKYTCTVEKINSIMLKIFKTKRLKFFEETFEKLIEEIPFDDLNENTVFTKKVILTKRDNTPFMASLLLFKYKKLDDEEKVVVYIIEEGKYDYVLFPIINELVDIPEKIFVITDPDGKIIFVNKKFEEITGFKFEDVYLKTPSSWKSGVHSTEFYKYFWKTIKKGKMWYGYFINRRKNGKIFRVRSIVIPIIDKNGNVKYFFAIQELTEEQEEAEVIKTLPDIQKKYTLAKKFFFSIVKGLEKITANLIKTKMKLKPLEEYLLYPVEENLENIQNTLSKFKLLMFSDTIKTKNISLETIINKNMELFKQNNITVLNIDIEEFLPYVKTAPEGIQILLEIIIELMNEFKKDDKVKLEIKLQKEKVSKEKIKINYLESSPFPYNIVLKFTMNNVEIPYTAENEKISLLQEIAKILSLGIKVEKNGKNTQISLVFNPSGEIWENVNEAYPMNIKEISFQNKNILFIESDSKLLELIRLKLREKKANVLTADNGIEGLKLFRNSNVDVVVVSLSLTGINGFEVAKTIKKENKNVKIIMTSKYSKIEFYEKFGSFNIIDDYIQKPYTFEKLLVKIDANLKK